ncbi:hypothetical protein BU23DRAFT_600746, partial [Bimuria novae-zelandiae CBS 107.79]
VHIHEFLRQHNLPPRPCPNAHKRLPHHPRKQRFLQRSFSPPGNAAYWGRGSGRQCDCGDGV